jgi:hypothetical protein
MNGASANSHFEKGRPANEPGARLGNDRHGVIAPRPEIQVDLMGEQPGKNRTSLRGSQRETVPGTSARKSSSLFTKNSSPLPPLSTAELIRETQGIVLQFPTYQVAEEQGASPRAIENQRNGESAISLRNAINWARRNPRVRARFMYLMGCESETDPDFVQGISLLFNEFVRLRTSDASSGTPDELIGGDASDCETADLFGGPA